MKVRNVLKYIGLRDVLFFIVIATLVLDIQTSLTLIEIEILMIRLGGCSACDPMIEVYMAILATATTTVVIMGYIIWKNKEIKKRCSDRGVEENESRRA